MGAFHSPDSQAGQDFPFPQRTSLVLSQGENPPSRSYTHREVHLHSVQLVFLTTWERRETITLISTRNWMSLGYTLCSVLLQ